MTLSEDLNRMVSRGIIMCDCKHTPLSPERMACRTCLARLVQITIKKEQWLLTRFEYKMVKHFIIKAYMIGEPVAIKC